MIGDNKISVQQYAFSPQLFDKISAKYYLQDLWPIVYIISDNKSGAKEAYVGETTDVDKRMSTHLKSKTKKKLTSVHLIDSKQLNKSATLDIESNLIKYMSGDGKFKLQNGTLGLANHTYYQKPEYWRLFKTIWNELRSKGIAIHSIEHIDNSDLFKYSPYKSLKKEQVEGLKDMLMCILNDNYENIVIEGGAGTGKTILAVFLFKILVTDNEDFNFKEFGDQEAEFVNLIRQIKTKFPNPKMGLVIPMSSFRGTLKKVFKNIKGLKASMVVGPADVTREKFDILLVDESHRLRKKKSIGAYIGAFNNAAERLGLDSNKTNELEWVVLQSLKTILFYDEDQSIKPSDVNKSDFDQLKKSKFTIVRKLKSQFRVNGGNAYVEFIDKLLKCGHIEGTNKFASNNYEFLLFDSVSHMVEEVKAKDKKGGLARVIAGFSWEWVSNKEGKEHLKDIKIGDTELRWNYKTKDWVNSENAVNEVGCIHTTQGYDLNYAGIIFGNEITYDKELGEIVIIKENYFDSTGRQADTPEALKNYIVNIYKTLMLRGIKGTYIYVCNPILREYFKSFIPSRHTEKTTSIQIFKMDNIIPFENSVPLYDLKVAAGDFGEIQQIEDVDWVKMPDNIKPSEDLFACQVIGESMNKIIPNGSYCLFRKYSGGTRNGHIVLVENTNMQDTDFGSCYTIKEYESKKYEDEEGWKHESIILKPISSDSNYENIVLAYDELSSFKVIGIFECIL